MGQKQVYQSKVLEQPLLNILLQLVSGGSETFSESHKRSESCSAQNELVTLEVNGVSELLSEHRNFIIMFSLFNL